MKNILILTTALFLMALHPVLSQNKAPLNSNYLIERGISPRVLDAAASSFMQDGRFIYEVKVDSKKNGKLKSYEFSIIYDPAYEEGMDIQIVNKGEQLSRKELKKLKKYIEKSHYFSRMARHYLYDESTLKFAREVKDTVVLTYEYEKQDIDPYIKAIKKMKGEVYLVRDSLYKVVLKNAKPLPGKLLGYTKTIHYAKAQEGGYVATKILEDIVSGNKKQQSTYHTSKLLVNYTDDSGERISWNQVQPSGQPLATENYDTINVKLGGVLPIWGKAATKLGFQLPQPVGVAGFIYSHNQLMEFTGLQVSFDGGNMVDLKNLFALDASEVKQSTQMTMAKGDVWLFPFLNIMAIVGGGTNDLDGELVINDELRDFLNGLPGWIIDIPNIPKSLPIKSRITSELYGGGVTLAGAVQDFNISVNYQLMFTKIIEANTTNMVHIITPMVGYMAPFGVNFMIGGQGQFYNTQLSGFFEFDDSTGNPHRLDYLVDFEPIQWNAIVGFYKGFSKHWEISVQAGFGSRSSMTAVFGYRF